MLHTQRLPVSLWSTQEHDALPEHAPLRNAQQLVQALLKRSHGLQSWAASPPSGVESTACAACV